MRSAPFSKSREPKIAPFPFSWLAGDEAQPNQGETAMTIKTNVKAGGLTIQHNETLAVRSNVQAGTIQINHNESFRR
jgi:hypothetical protein